MFVNPLFVFALASEAQDLFADCNTLFTGVGKVNASYNLTKRIGEQRPDLIINLGTAGSNYFERESIVCCTHFVQRDMNASLLGCSPYETPFSKDKIILQHGIDISFLQKGVCGSGDSFEVGHKTSYYNVVDMEAYALAYIAKSEKIPFLCLKYISDGADESAPDDWEIMVHKSALALRQAINEVISENYISINL